MKYRIYTAKHFDELEDIVSKAILLGWKPQGGCTVAIMQEKYPIVAQAMIKEKKQ